MRKLSKTLLSLLLIAAMLASFVVLPAAAEEPAAEQPTEAVQAAETQVNDAVNLLKSQAQIQRKVIGRKRV